MVLFSRRLPSLLRVPASPVPRSPQYYEGATTSHSRISRRLLVRFRRPRIPPVSCLAYALLQARRSLAGQGLVVAGCPAPASYAWTRMGSLRSSGDPSDAFAAFHDPGRAEMSSPLTGTSVLPPLPTWRRLQRHFISGLTRSFGICYLRFTRGVAARMQGSLPAGGLRLCREGVEPSGSHRKVSGYIHPSFQDFA